MDNAENAMVTITKERYDYFIWEIERLRGALRDIYEVYAGSEGIPKPMTAAEGYLLQLLMEAVRIAARALAGKIEEAIEWHHGKDTVLLKNSRDEIERLRAENAELRKSTEWQPIETAPKDGTVIIGKQLGDETGDGITLMFWYKTHRAEAWAHSLGVKVKDGKQVKDNHSVIGLDGMSLWMPLREPLKTTGGE